MKTVVLLVWFWFFGSLDCYMYGLVYCKIVCCCFSWLSCYMYVLLCIVSLFFSFCCKIHMVLKPFVLLDFIVSSWQPCYKCEVCCIVSLFLAPHGNHAVNMKSGIFLVWFTLFYV